MDSNRGILSCASCRHRKLKCDRKDHCGNCIARGVDCIYATYTRGRGSAQRRDPGQAQLDARIRHLEQVIQSIAAEKTREAPQEVPDLGRRHEDSDEQGIQPGRIMASASQTAYVSGTHWAAICNDVADIREYLDRNIEEDQPDTPDPTRRGGPMLLDGLRETSDMQDILSDIPPRKAADWLVSRYFNATEMGPVILHAPTFEAEYRRFWADPTETSTPWIALLFGMLSIGTFLSLRSQDGLPADLGPPQIAMEAFQRRSTECLIISNYSTSPSLYTLEAVILNAQNEFIRRRDASVGVWVLGAVGIRLAMRMGYHRDASGYSSQISPFQGEMRRRVWANVMQVDSLLSCQLGLPSMIEQRQSDTALPRNLLDEDFGPDTTELPPSRPETELTPVLYVITKSRLSAVFRTIFGQVSLGRTEAYSEIMALDKRLRDVNAAISPRFQLDSAITVSPYLLIRRYALVLLYLKSRCVLHRYHMTKSYSDSRYSYSRASCVEAAMAILDRQASILKEFQPGGILYRCRWLISSLEQTDFALASMIVCLEISSCATSEPGSPRDEHGFRKYSRPELIAALEASHRYLAELKENSKECAQAHKILSVMLQKLGQGQTQLQVVPSSAQGSFSGVSSESMSHSHMPPVVASDSSGSVYPESDPQISLPAYNATGMGDIGSFFHTPDIVDWDLWEEFTQGSRTMQDFDSSTSHS